MFYRRASLPKAVINDIYMNDNIIKVVQDDEDFMKSIKIVSNSLYDMILKEKKTDKQIKQIKASVERYFLRLGSRTSSYQMFGSLSNSECNESFIDYYISMKWFKLLTKNIELLQEKKSNMLLYISSTIFSEEDYYIRISYFSNNSKKKSEYKIKKRSIIGKLLLEIQNKKSLKYSEAFDFIYFYVNDEILSQKILRKLIKNDILKSDVINTNINVNQNLLLEKLLKIAATTGDIELCNQINLIGAEFKKFYKTASIVRLSDHLDNTTTMMNNLVPKVPPIIFNTYISNNEINEKFCINTEDFDIFRYMNFIKEDYLFIQKFEEQFLDTYGYYNEVPIKILLSPSNTRFSERNLKKLCDTDKLLIDKRKKFKTYFSRIINEAEYTKKTIDLNDHIENIKKILYTKKDFYYVEYDLKVRKISNNEIYLPSTSFAFPAGSYGAKYRYINEGVESPSFLYNIDYMLNYVPDIGLLFNESNKKNSINVAVDGISNSESLLLDDIVVACDKEGMFIKDIKTGYKIIPVYKSMASLNFINEDYIARFFVKYGNYQLLPPAQFEILDYLSFNHIPRVMLHSNIISKEMWNIVPDNQNDIELYIKKFIKLYKVPNCIALLELGEEYPILLDNELGMGTLVQHIKKFGSATLLEYPEMYNYDSSHIVECVDKHSIGEKNYNSNSLILSKEHDSSPSKYYYSFTLLFSGEINSILENLLNFSREENIQFFFTRYIDEKKHSLRVRFLKNKCNEEHILSFLFGLFKENFIDRYYPTNYIPERNRYGHKELLEEAETIFILDSEFAITNNRFYLSDEKCCVQLILRTFLKCYGGIEKTFNLLDRVFYKNKKVNVSNKEYSKLVKESLLESSCNENREIENLIRNYFKKVTEKYEEEIADYMIVSFMHMRINRYIGITSEEENYFYLAKRLLKTTMIKNKIKKE